MGRHADPDRGSFYRSLGVAVLRALLALAVVTLVVGIAIAVGSSSRPGGPGLIGSPAAEHPPPSGPGSSPTPAASPEAARDGDRGHGVTVQVLDGGAGTRRTAEAAELLRGLGYRVVTVRTARCCYPHTTVFYREGAGDDAEVLLGRDPRFTRVEPNVSLSDSVALHVVVGRDWPDRPAGPEG